MTGTSSAQRNPRSKPCDQPSREEADDQQEAEEPVWMGVPRMVDGPRFVQRPRSADERARNDGNAERRANQIEESPREVLQPDAGKQHFHPGDRSERE